MSQIRVNDIRDSAGNNSSTPSQIYNGRAKIWVNFNGVGTVAIRDDYGVNSVSDNGGGDYTVNFSTAFSDNDYVILGCAGSTDSPTPSSGMTAVTIKQGVPLATGSARLSTNYQNGGVHDQDTTCVAAFR